jgi:hypothetical protein
VASPNAAADPKNDEGEQFDDEPGDQPYAPDDIPPEREVVTLPLDSPVKSLLDDIQSKSLIVNPPFQRRDVWDRVRKSRLIESLLLNIPIPVLFLAEDNDGSRVVVDGQQRLRAIEQFTSGQFPLSGLQVLPGLNKKRWVDLSPRQARIILNRTLRCIVISASSDPNLRFEVFERLNTYGVSLNDQELRNSIYRGRFNDFLNDLATDENWLRLLQRKEPDNRLQHHEMILRYLSMLEASREYRPPLKGWLNEFMREKRDLSDADLARYRESFERSCRAVATVFQTDGSQPFRRVRASTSEGYEWDKTLNRPAFELQMLGLMDEDLGELEKARVRVVDAFAALCLEDDEFADALSRATADRSRSRTRFEKWGTALDRIGITNSLREKAPALA